MTRDQAVSLAAILGGLAIIMSALMELEDVSPKTKAILKRAIDDGSDLVKQLVGEGE